MFRLKPVFFASVLVCLNALGQPLPANEKATVEAARLRYYNLQRAGFDSLSCSVKFDFSTVPLLRNAGDDSPMSKLLRSTTFTLSLDLRGRPSFQATYPEDVTDVGKQQASQITNLLTAMVMGLFQTWPSKGLVGPIPPFDSEIDQVTATDHGYVFSLQGSRAQVMTDRNYLAIEIVSAEGKLKEHPTYVPTTEGLVFAGVDVLDESHPEGPVEVHYEVGTAILNGLRVPVSAHIRVNKTIDMRFSLDSCSVKKAIVVQLAAPPDN